MARKQNLAAALMAEVISYGGLPVTRETAYRLAFDATGCRKAADTFAFARYIEPLPDCAPLTYEQVAEFVSLHGED